MFGAKPDIKQLDNKDDKDLPIKVDDKDATILGPILRGATSPMKFNITTIQKNNETSNNTASHENFASKRYFYKWDQEFEEAASKKRSQDSENHYGFLLYFVVERVFGTEINDYLEAKKQIDMPSNCQVDSVLIDKKMTHVYARQLKSADVKVQTNWTDISKPGFAYMVDLNSSRWHVGAMYTKCEPHQVNYLGCAENVYNIDGHKCIDVTSNVKADGTHSFPPDKIIIT